MKSLLLLSLFNVLTHLTSQEEIPLTKINYSDEESDNSENEKNMGPSQLAEIKPGTSPKVRPIRPWDEPTFSNREIKYLLENWEEIPELIGTGDEKTQEDISDDDYSLGHKKELNLDVEDSAKRWADEQAAGNPAEIYGTNRHYYQPDSYNDLSRRFVPQYQYIEAKDIQKNKVAQNVAPEGKEIIPIKAPLELVELAAKEAAGKQPKNPKDSGEDSARNNILRTGDYWNSVWIEEVDPSKPLRSLKKKALGTIKAKVQPGTEFYQVASKMKKMSPRLLYIINEKE